MDNVKHYAERNAEDLGQVFMDHLMAMTAEKLHRKSAIAAELEAQLAGVGSYPVAEVVRNTSWQIILRNPVTKNAWDMSTWVGYELYARKNDSAGGE